MTEQHPSFWMRVKWTLTGRPVSHDQAQAARAQHAQDVMTQTQLAARDQRYGAGGSLDG